jgi:hypothetical protein
MEKKAQISTYLPLSINKLNQYSAFVNPQISPRRHTSILINNQAGSQAACRISGLTVPAQVNQHAIVLVIETIIATVVFGINSDSVIT